MFIVPVEAVLLSRVACYRPQWGMQNNLDVAVPLSRRGLLAGGVAAGAAALLGSSPARGSQPPAVIPGGSAGGRKRVLRFAHPTDIHVQPELKATEGMTACFAHMMSLADRPELIITGGDLPMDSRSTPEPRSRVEWDLFKQVLADTVPAAVRIEHACGNHDIFGHNRKSSGLTGSESFFGKKWFLDAFGYKAPYRSFDRAGWHFIVLDSMELLPEDDYRARLDPEQMAWLKADLAATPASTPVVVVSHAPIMSVANFLDKADTIWQKTSIDLVIEDRRMHTDCREIEAVFRKHGNVKLCLSGHLHLLDRCTYNGVTYICDGAVSGAKWRGSKRQTPEGYGLIDLYSDGTFEHTYQGFGWVAVGKPLAPAEAPVAPAR